MCRRSRASGLHLLALSLAVGCGGAAGGPAAAGAVVPPTDADPPAAVPRPASTPEAGRPVALALAAGSGRAGALAVAVLDAMRRGDGDALEVLLSERVVRVQPRLGAGVWPREALLRHLLDPRLRRDGEAALPLARLARLDALRIERVRDRHPDGAEGLLADDDLIVTVPLEARGRAFFAPVVPGWSTQAVLLVRLSNGGRVVGL